MKKLATYHIVLGLSLWTPGYYSSYRRHDNTERKEQKGTKVGAKGISVMIKELGFHPLSFTMLTWSSIYTHPYPLQRLKCPPNYSDRRAYSPFLKVPLVHPAPVAFLGRCLPQRGSSPPGPPLGPPGRTTNRQRWRDLQVVTCYITASYCPAEKIPPSANLPIGRN